MKKRYLSIIALGAALFTWNCGDSSSKAESLPSTADFPYYIGNYGIDPSTGAVTDLTTGVVVGQLNADGTVTDANGAIILAADTTMLPTFTTGGFLVNKNGIVTDLSGEVIGTLNEDNTVTKKDGSVIDLEGNIIKEADLIASSESEEVVSSSSIASDPEATLLNTVAVGSIYSDLTVRDANGKVIGTFDANSGHITLTDGTVVTPEGTVVSSPKSSASTGKSSNSVSNSSNSQQTQSSNSQQGTGSIKVTGSLNQTVQKNSAIATVTLSGVSAEPTRSWKLYWLDVKYANGSVTISGTVPEYFQDGTTEENFVFNEGTITLTINVGQASQMKSSSSQQQQQQKSSSSVAKSSSSVAKSSSSVAKSSSSKANISGNTDIVYISGGASGTGFASRYWDCCKPSCSWTANAGNNTATQCNANGTTKLSDLNATSVCQSGTASTCKSQIPIIVNDNLAYAFAAVPASNGGQCGHCYALEFTGTGKYEDKAPQQGLKGKILVVMASNVGADVAQGQFDVMIPGGGVGLYNGCANMGWGDMGQTYGGLLSDCETEVGYSKTGATLTNARKECLTNKCNKTFANDAVAKEGCMFLATWMNAAGNPNHNYREVECPSALKSMY